MCVPHAARRCDTGVCEWLSGIWIGKRPRSSGLSIAIWANSKDLSARSTCPSIANGCPTASRAESRSPGAMRVRSAQVSFVARCHAHAPPDPPQARRRVLRSARVRVWARPEAFRACVCRGQPGARDDRLHLQRLDGRQVERSHVRISGVDLLQRPVLARRGGPISFVVEPIVPGHSASLRSAGGARRTDVRATSRAATSPSPGPCSISVRVCLQRGLRGGFARPLCDDDAECAAPRPVRTLVWRYTLGVRRGLLAAWDRRVSAPVRDLCRRRTRAPSRILRCGVPCHDLCSLRGSWFCGISLRPSADANRSAKKLACSSLAAVRRLRTYWGRGSARFSKWGNNEPPTTASSPDLLKVRWWRSGCRCSKCSGARSICAGQCSTPALACQNVRRLLVISLARRPRDLP